MRGARAAGGALAVEGLEAALTMPAAMAKGEDKPHFPEQSEAAAEEPSVSSSSDDSSRSSSSSGGGGSAESSDGASKEDEGTTDSLVALLPMDQLEVLRNT